MREVTAGRTLVKSPPELWAVCSDANSLAQHLEAFGEIRITRLEPETTVAWEGERASGTVRIEPSGWGTKVTVTAAQTQPVEGPALTVTTPATEQSPPVSPEPDAHALQPERVLEPESEPPPESGRSRRPGFFARLFGGGRAPVAQPVLAEVGDTRPEVVQTPVAAPPADPEVSPVPGPAADGPGAVDAAAALEAALDSLGQAHRRPFSR